MRKRRARLIEHRYTLAGQAVDLNTLANMSEEYLRGQLHRAVRSLAVGKRDDCFILPLASWDADLWLRKKLAVAEFIARRYEL